MLPVEGDSVHGIYVHIWRGGSLVFDTVALEGEVEAMYRIVSVCVSGWKGGVRGRTLRLFLRYILR